MSALLCLFQVLELLAPLVSDSEVPIEVAGFAALALGMVFTSSCKEDVVMSLLGVSVALGAVEGKQRLFIAHARSVTSS